MEAAARKQLTDRQPADESSRARPRRNRPAAKGSGQVPGDTRGRATGQQDVQRPPADRHKVDKPDAGRSTRLGRKVESPALPQPAGPSGQRTRTQEQKRHSNK